MRNLLLTDVPDEVVEQLERAAAREGTSVEAVAIRDLTESLQRADNAALLSELPDLKIPVSELIYGVAADRSTPR